MQAERAVVVQQKMGPRQCTCFLAVQVTVLSLLSPAEHCDTELVTMVHTVWANQGQPRTPTDPTNTSLPEPSGSHVWKDNWFTVSVQILGDILVFLVPSAVASRGSLGGHWVERASCRTAERALGAESWEVRRLHMASASTAPGTVSSRLPCFPLIFF